MLAPQCPDRNWGIFLMPPKNKEGALANAFLVGFSYLQERQEPRGHRGQPERQEPRGHRGQPERQEPRGHRERQGCQGRRER